MTVTNGGPDDATGVVVTDPLPSGVTLISLTASQGDCTGTDTITCNLGALANGASAVVTLTVQAEVSGILVNTATVTSTTARPGRLQQLRHRDGERAPARVSVNKRDERTPRDNKDEYAAVSAVFFLVVPGVLDVLYVPFAARPPPSPSTIGFMRSPAALPILLLALALPLSAQSPSGEKITNGVLDSLHPTVGLFIVDGECTATLIGCRTVLTAAHCICGDHLGGVKCAARPDLVDPAGKFVFFQNAGLFALSSLAVDPAYNAYTGVSDLAILHLATPVTNIAPSPLNRTGPPPLGLPGVIVGFGSTHTDSTDDGLKRQGNVKTAACDPPADGFVCWNFKKPLGTRRARTRTPASATREARSSCRSGARRCWPA